MRRHLANPVWALLTLAAISAYACAATTVSFTQGVNLGGGATVIEGQSYLSYATAEAQGLSATADPELKVNSLTLSPAPSDAGTRSMLHSTISAPEGSTLHLRQPLANGSYELRLYVIEDTASHSRLMSVTLQGARVATGIGNLARGGWAVYGPYPAVVNDGFLRLRISAARGSASLAGFAVYQQGKFVAGVNLNGPSAFVSGEPWIAQSAAQDHGLAIWADPMVLSGPGTTYLPATDSGTRDLLRSRLAASTSLSLSEPLANGTYDIYLYVTEDSAPRSRSLNVSLQGVAAATGIGSLPLGGWARYGPLTAVVTDGSLRMRITASLGDATLSGFSVFEHGGINYSISFSDPNRALNGNTSALQAQIEGALSSWGRYISGKGSLEILVVIDATVAGRAQAESACGEVVGTAPDGSRIVEQGAAYELRTGVDPNGPAPDVIITIDPGYLENELWMDPYPLARTTPVPAERTDAVSVFTHELIHAFGMIGYLDPASLKPMHPGAWVGKYDLLVKYQGDGWFFTGTRAVAAYGRIVPLTSMDPTQNIYHFGNSDDGTLQSDLMNGISFTQGRRYFISALDRAVLRDLGLSIR